MKSGEPFSKVICASGEVGDLTSRVFVKSFYQGLAAGKCVEESFHLAKGAFEVIVLEGQGKSSTNFLLFSARGKKLVVFPDTPNKGHLEKPRESMRFLSYVDVNFRKKPFWTQASRLGR